MHSFLNALKSLCALTLVLPAFMLPASAQTLPAGTGGSDELVVLPEFTVQAATDGSYDAADSLVGSRVKTEIRNLPYNVNVVTSEFIQDFAAYEMEDEMAYTSSFTQGQGNSVDYVLRGNVGSATLRNGVKGRSAISQLARERVEVIKGPAAVIFGQCDPGGIVNVTTKRPKTRPGVTVRVAGGGCSMYRGELDVTGPLGCGFYYRAGLAKYYREYEQQFAFTDQLLGNFTLMKKIGAHTAFTLDFETARTDRIKVETLPMRSRQIQTTPYRKNLYTYAMDLLEASPGTPDASGEGGSSSLFLTFEHRFSRVWSMRTVVNYGWSDSRDHYYVGNLYIGDDNDGKGEYFGASNGRRQAQHSATDGWSWNAQNDLLARFSTGDAEHQILLTTDVTINDGNRLTLQMPFDAPPAEPGEGRVENIKKLYINDPDYWLQPFSTKYYTERDTAYDYNMESYGGFLRYQLALGGGRFIAMAGVRYDYIKADKMDTQGANVNNPVYSAFDWSAITPQVGFNYKITDRFTFYANRSTSFLAPSGNDLRRLEHGDEIKNQTSLGYEAGIKGSLFGQTLNFTVAAFRIDRENVRSTEMELIPRVDANGDIVIDPNTGEPELMWDDVLRAQGFERATGVEFDFNWKVSRSFMLFGAANYVDSRMIRSGRDFDAVGRPPRSCPPKRASLGLRYAFPKNFLSGLAFVSGLQYVDKMAAIAPNGSGGVQDASGYVYASNGARDIMIPGYAVLDAGLSYKFKMLKLSGRRLSHSVQVNVKNVLDRVYLSSRARQGDRLNVIGTYTLSY